MKFSRIGLWIAIGAALACSSVALAQKKSGSETGLIGIKLYDTGLRVVSIYGTPDEIEAVNVGGVSMGAGGGGGRGKGAGPAGPGGPGGPGGPAAGGGASAASTDPYGFDFASSLLRQGAAPGPAVAPPGTNGSGPGTNGPGGPAGPLGPGGGNPGGPGGGAQGQDNKVIFTRWIYNRAGSKYGFVFDKFNRVVQIEAIGLQNNRVRTKRGLGFGATFAQIIKKYSRNPDGSTNAPDGYEINGQNLVVRYLVKNKVAFRLSRLGKDKPQVVTGIVVAAGKL